MSPTPLLTRYYLMFEVVERASVDFSSRLDEATDLDGIIAAHHTFLSTIEAKAMLRPQVQAESTHAHRRAPTRQRDDA